MGPGLVLSSDSIQLPETSFSLGLLTAPMCRLSPSLCFLGWPKAISNPAVHPRPPSRPGGGHTVGRACPALASGPPLIASQETFVLFPPLPQHQGPGPTPGGALGAPEAHPARSSISRVC